MKELTLSELSVGQKLGMCLCAHLNMGEEDVSYVLSMIREHRLGAVWIQPETPGREDIIRRVKEAADYPILIMCDAENGYGDYKIPQVISMTASGARSEYARSFGRAVATVHSRMGYNVVCNPLLDICKSNCPCGGTTRTFGSDKETVARLGGEVAAGMHEGGVLTVAKHYPGSEQRPYDSHMRENYSTYSKKTVVEEYLYPYIQLNNKGLLDGVMTGHKRLPKIDPDRPASLSRKLLTLLREQGFGGFYITDALCMMGIRLKYGDSDAHGLCVHAGNSFALSWDIHAEVAYGCLKDSYEKGLFSEDDLNDAVRHTLEAMHKTTLLPHPEKVLPEDGENIAGINRECISAVCAEGLTPAISHDGKHLFVITTEGYVDMNVAEDPMMRLYQWYSPHKIAERLKSLFPNSGTVTFPCYPSSGDVWKFFGIQGDYDDLVFITFYQSESCTGREHLTTRLVDLMDAMQSTDRIIAQLHFGSPFVAADAPYIPRVILGLASEKCVEEGIAVLHGDAEAKGILPYDIKFHKKGYIFR